MKTTIETYSGKEINGKPELLYSEEVDIPEPELTTEQKEIQQLKDRVSALEAAKYSL